jgi:hypothetical protein
MLHVEGELDGKEASGVDRHVKDCWACRTTCERLEQGIFVFMEFHDAVPLPPPPPRRHHFSRRLREQETGKPSGSLARTLLSALSPSGVAAVLIFAAVFFLVRPPTLSSQEFLSHARAASRTFDSRGTRRVVYQKIRIQRGTDTFQRALYRGTSAPVAQPEPPNRELLAAMDSARLNWEDPLNADDFAVWHDAQSKKHDAVRETAKLATLETAVLNSGPLRMASLTVERATWRPIARRVEFRDQPPLEITEEAFEIRELPAAEPAHADVVEPRAAQPARESRIAESLPGSTGRTTGPTMAELAEAELRLREAFHEIRADVRETPEIWIADQRVYFRAFADTAERREEIRQAVEQIPYVFESATSQVSLSMEPEKLTVAYATTPPLAKALRDHLGGLDVANNYLDSVRDTYFRLLAETLALDRLGQRYSSGALPVLSSAEQTRVAHLATDHISRIHAATAEYLGLVTPVLESMSRSSSPANGSSPPTSASCSSWDAAAKLAADDLRRLEQNFIRLFVQDQVPEPVQLSEEGLLNAVRESRAALETHLENLCAPR